MTAAGAAAAVAETTIRSVRRTASAFVGRRATAAFAVWTVAATPVERARRVKLAARMARAVAFLSAAKSNAAWTVAAIPVGRVRTISCAVLMGFANAFRTVLRKCVVWMAAVAAVVSVPRARNVILNNSVSVWTGAVKRRAEKMPVAMCAVSARMVPLATVPVCASAHPIAPTRIVETMDAGASAERAEPGRFVPSMANVP